MGGRLVEAEILGAFHQRKRRIEGSPHLSPRFSIGPEPGEIDMGMARQHQFSIRGEALLQLLQPRRQRLKGGSRRSTLLFGETRRIGYKLRQFPDLLLHDGISGAGDVSRRIRRPVETAQRPLGGLHQMRHDLMIAERADRFGDLLQKKMQAVDGTVEPDQPGLVEPRRPVRSPKGKRATLSVEIEKRRPFTGNSWW